MRGRGIGVYRAPLVNFGSVLRHSEVLHNVLKCLGSISSILCRACGVCLGVSDGIGVY